MEIEKERRKVRHEVKHSLSINELMLSLGKHIVSDADFDGVTAALILGNYLIRHGVVPEVIEFCAPWDREKRDSAVIIEFPERAGEGSLVLDHHDKELGSIGYYSLNGERLGDVGEVKSVAGLVHRLSAEELPPKVYELLRYANIIDTNPPARVPELLSKEGLEPLVYLGYRLMIGNPEWRRRVAEAIKSGDLSRLNEVAEWLINTFREAGKVAEEVLPKVAKEIVEGREKVFTVPDIGEVVLIPLRYGERLMDLNVLSIDLEQAALRHVQALASKRHPDAALIICYITSERGRGLSIASPKGLAGKLAEALRDYGYAESGGGRPNIAGAQGIKFSIDEAPKVITEVLGRIK